MQCCFLAFWLCSFACGRAFLDDEMSLCLCLWLANTKTWFSPSPAVFFFLVLIFFYYNWIVFWSCFFTVVFLAPSARPFSGAVCSFRLLLLAPLYPKCNPLSLCFFAALLLSFLLSCWTCWSCCLFFLATLRSNTCPTMPPLCPVVPRFVHFFLPSVQKHSYAPYQPTCAHWNPLHEHAHDYVCGGVCSCFCVVVDHTACVRVIVIALAGGSVLVFCVYLGVSGWTTCLHMCSYV